jgi:hypothetical protein
VDRVFGSFERVMSDDVLQEADEITNKNAELKPG